VRWYNHEHRHSAIRFVTPAQRHANLDQDILVRLAALYETARQRNPLRWKGPTRNWKRIHAVHLNPDRTDDHGIIQPRRPAIIVVARAAIIVDDLQETNPHFGFVTITGIVMTLREGGKLPLQTFCGQSLRVPIQPNGGHRPDGGSGR
jgi:hypothetical protein